MAPKRRKSGTRTSDLTPLIQKYLPKPVNINYREKQYGAMDVKVLQEWLKFLSQFPAVVKQTVLAGALSQWAASNEKTWHLAGPERDDWSERTAKKIRAMRKDVCTCINRKPHSPKWFTDALEKLGIDIDGLDDGLDEASENENVDAAKAESKPQETEKATCTAQSVNPGLDLAQRVAETPRPAWTSHSEGPRCRLQQKTGGKFIYKFDEDCQAHSYG